MYILRRVVSHALSSFYVSLSLSLPRSQVNTAVHEPSVMYPIPCNDASGASFNLLLGSLQGMMLRVDQLQKKRLLMLILMEASIKNQVGQELYRRQLDPEEDWDEEDEEDAKQAQFKADRATQRQL